MVARAAASFEAGNLVIVNKRFEDKGGDMRKSALRASKGALQHSMAGGLRLGEADTIEVCMCVFVYVCIYVCMYVCVNVCMCVNHPKARCSTVWPVACDWGRLTL